MKTIAEDSGVQRVVECDAFIQQGTHIGTGDDEDDDNDELLSIFPSQIMRKLLNLYKDCRFLDRLMGTSFFHEDHFLVSYWSTF